MLCRVAERRPPGADDRSRDWLTLLHRIWNEYTVLPLVGWRIFGTAAGYKIVRASAGLHVRNTSQDPGGSDTR
jgi:hypothetical protein